MTLLNLLELIERLQKAGLEEDSIVQLTFTRQEGNTQYSWAGVLDTVSLDVEMGFNEAFRDHEHLPTPRLVLSAKLDVPEED